MAICAPLDSPCEGNSEATVRRGSRSPQSRQPPRSSRPSRSRAHGTHAKVGDTPGIATGAHVDLVAGKPKGHEVDFILTNPLKLEPHSHRGGDVGRTIGKPASQTVFHAGVHHARKGVKTLGQTIVG